MVRQPSNPPASRTPSGNGPAQRPADLQAFRNTRPVMIPAGVPFPGLSLFPVDRRLSATDRRTCGHAAVMCDPQFRQVLADRGFTINAETGEVNELAGSCCTATPARHSTSCGNQVAQACGETFSADRSRRVRPGPIVVRCGGVPAASGPPPDTATRFRTARVAGHDHAAVGLHDHRSGHTVQSGGLPALSS